jgi:putative tryptophan/tyrosine transport system substrate-binding protein
VCLVSLKNEPRKGPDQETTSLVRVPDRCPGVWYLEPGNSGDQMRRREFIALLGGTILVRPVGSRAQQSAKKPRVGTLGFTAMAPSLAEALKKGVEQFNYTEVVMEHRNSEGRPDLFSKLAAELVGLDVDVIFARGPDALAAAKAATSNIPIVAVDFESDPVVMGFVKNLARPGGNITGVFLDLPELSGKQLELIKEAFPQVARVAILGDPVVNAPQFGAIEAAARAFAVQPESIQVRVPSDIETALETAKTRHVEAVIFFSSPLVFNNLRQIGELAIAKRLPVVSLFPEFPRVGGFMAYGPSLPESFRRCGISIGKILQGAKPSDLPIERPERFELVINVRTAKALGVTVPPPLLARADEVIE